MKSSNGAIAVAVAVIAGAFLLGSQKDEPIDGGGAGDPGDPGDGGPFIGDPAAPGGSIQDIQVSQRQTVKMGRHKPAKLPGSNMTLSYKWSAGTVDALGKGRTWSYRHEIRVGHNVWWRWEEMGAQHGDVESGSREIEGSYGFGTWTMGPITFKMPSDNGVTWDVHITLFGAESDSDGTIKRDSNGDVQWMELGEWEHNGAFQTLDGQTVVSASIAGEDDIFVSQNRRRGGFIR